MWPSILVLFAVLLFYTTTSQPVNNDTENHRPSRQLDCCPCPESSDKDNLSQGVVVVDIGARSSQDNVEDGLQGSPSILFTSAVRPDRTIIATLKPKDQPKPLLSPEVDLAKSVLQTLHAVTEQGYKEALARDAARSAVEIEESIRDTLSTETDDINIIIHNQKGFPDDDEDLVNEASHTQEARCIYPPLGGYKTNLGKMRLSAPKPSHLMHDEFKSKSLLHKNLLNTDSYLDASNIQENIVTPSNKGIKSLQLKDNSFNNDCDIDDKQNSPIKSGQLKSSLVSQLSTLNDDQNSDLRGDPSHIEERVALESKNKGFPKFAFKSLRLPETVPSSKKLNFLKNKLKLKDVEIIPFINERSKKNEQSTILVAKKNTPNFKNHQNTERSNDYADTNHFLDSGTDTDIFIKPNAHEQQQYEMNLPTGNLVETKTADILPSPSEDNALFVVKNVGGNNINKITKEYKFGDENINFKSTEEELKTNQDDDGNVIEPIVENLCLDSNEIDAEEAMTNLNYDKAVKLVETENVERDNGINYATNPYGNNIRIPTVVDPLTEGTETLDQNSKDPVEIEVLTPYSARANKNVEKNINTSSINKATSTENQGKIPEQFMTTLKPYFEPNSEIDESKELDMKDLQKLSDSILNSSIKNEDSSLNRTCDDNCCANDPKNSFPSSKDKNSEENNLNEKSFSDQENVGHENINDNDCHQQSLREIESEMSTAPKLEKNNESKEMISEASSSFDRAVQPDTFSNDMTPLKAIPLFNSIVVEPSSAIKSFPLPQKSLPLFEDLKMKLANIFNSDNLETKERSTTDCDVFNDEQNLPNIKMTAGESTNNFLSLLPSIKPLKDINLDIFEIKPSSPLINIPTINLNAYRAKLPIPDSISIKPIKLQSTLGDKGSMLGASLAIGNNEFSQGIKSLPRINDFEDKLSEIMSKSLKHTQNIQRSFQLIPKSLPKNNFDLLKEPFGKPDLTEIALKARSDINEKLKALHNNFNDRLTHSHYSRQKAPPVLTNRRKSNSKSAKMKPETLSSHKKKSNSKTNIGQDKLRSILENSNGSPNEEKIKSFKIRPSASVPVPKILEPPKMKSIKTTNTLFDQKRQNQLKSGPAKSGLSNKISNNERSTIEKNVKVLLKNKLNPYNSEVTISFSTTSRPTASNKPKITTNHDSTLTAKKNLIKSGNDNKISKSSPEFDLKSKLDDNKQSSLHNPTTNRLNTRQSDLAGVKHSPLWSTNWSKLKQAAEEKLKYKPSFMVRESRKPPTKTLTIPKTSASKKPTKNEPVKTDDKITSVLRSDTDMTREASQMLEATAVEPLKENVSYKCTLVCTKD